MTDKQKTSYSKFLSLVLRHQPDLIGLHLDKNGWAELSELLDKANQHGKNLNEAMIKEIVADCPKQRYAWSEDGSKIRANQGHSISVDLELQPTIPPALLYHGTASRYINDIRKTGLKKVSRQHVHLSADVATATNVGSRHGVPHILTIAAAEMQAAGYVFYVSANGVWLTEAVPLEFISF